MQCTSPEEDFFGFGEHLAARRNVREENEGIVIISVLLDERADHDFRTLVIARRKFEASGGEFGMNRLGFSRCRRNRDEARNGIAEQLRGMGVSRRSTDAATRLLKSGYRLV
jgi:hypothetical protein